MGEIIFKTVSLHKPVWKRLWDFKIGKDAESLSHAVVILLNNYHRLKKINKKDGHENQDNNQE